MINRELIEVFSEIARDKNVDRNELGTIIEQLFLYIIEKQHGDPQIVALLLILIKAKLRFMLKKLS